MNSTRPWASVLAAESSVAGRSKNLLEDVMKHRGLCQFASIGLAFSVLSCKAHETGREANEALRTWHSISSLSHCPQASMSQTGWLQAKSRDGRLTLRVPGDYSESHSGSAEVWFFQDGSVGYQVVPTAQRWEDSLSKDSTAPARRWCGENIDGRRAMIRFTYATPATGPGYYMLALVQFDSGRDLRLIGFMRDTLRAQVLLQIARSVRINGE